MTAHPRSFIALALAASLVPATLLAAPGGLDPTFAGGTGRLRIGRGPAFETCEAMLVQPDGRSVSVGSSQAGTESAIALIRRNTDGTPDAGFGTGGMVLTRLPGRTIFGHAVARQPDGKIVVAGEFLDGDSFDFLVCRYTTSGLLDPTFGIGGVVVTSLGGDDRADGIAVQPNGRIVVVGGSLAGGNSSFAAVRYLANGTPDPQFGNQGIVLADLGNSLDDANAVAVLDDSSLILTGSTFNPLTAVNRMALLKLTANGALDTSFSQDGIQSTTFGGPNDTGRAVVIQQGMPDKIVVAATSGALGGTSTRFALARYSLAGKLDYSFDGNGRLTVQPLGFDGGATALAIQYDPNGTPRILVTGPCASGRLTILRRLDNGDPDNTFDGDGVYLAPLNPGGETGSAIQVSGSRIVAAGTRRRASSSHGEFEELRLLLSGAPDPAFDGDGIRTDAVGRSDLGHVALAVQPDGKVVVAGHGITTPGPFTLYRLRADGTPDPTFGAGGLAGGFVDLANAAVGLVVEPDGRIAVASDGCFVARYLPNGGPDLDFGFNGIGGFSKCVEATGFARQPDGGLLLCGRNDDRMAVVRLNADGTSDDEFGTNGVASADDWPLSNAAAISVLPDGRFVLAGSATPEAATHAAVARFMPDGKPDDTFGSNGHVLTEIGDESAIEAIVLQSDGRVVAAGFRTNGFSRNLLLFRYKEDGDLDPSFGEGGIVLPTLDVDLDQSLALAYERDSKILLTGARLTLAPDSWGGLIPTHEFVAAAFNANGTPDLTYGTSGVAVTDLGDRTDDLPHCVTFDPLERAVIAGSSSGFIGIVRLRTGSTTSVPEPVGDTARFQLGQAVPNPMRGWAVLELVLANPEPVRADVIDPAGRRVRALIDDELRAGSHAIAWDGRDDSGRPVSGGVYFVRVNAGGVQRVRRVTVVG